MPKPIEILPEADMVTWQRQLVAYVSTKPDVRRTVWIWSTAGGVGKTRIAISGRETPGHGVQRQGIGRLQRNHPVAREEGRVAGDHGHERASCVQGLRLGHGT